MPALATGTPVHFDTGSDLRALASCRRDRVRFVDIPAKRYLAIDGHEVPGSPEFVACIGALYGTAYQLHFTLRRRGVRGHRVGMLEGLYWLTPAQLLADETAADPSRPWSWRLLIAVPDEATDAEAEGTIAGAGEFAGRIDLERWAEGPSAQILHVGSYADETPTLRRLHAAIEAAGFSPHGPHHEIYLNDPQRAGEDRTKTVLRQAVMPV